MTESGQSPVNFASHQPNTQAKEVSVIVLIGILRLLAQPLASGLKTRPGSDAARVAHFIYSVAIVIKPLLLAIVLSIIAYLLIARLFNRPVPRRLLDGIGILFFFSMLAQFAKINLLMLANTGPANILLAEVVLFVFYFAIVWGWIFWRVDAATTSASNEVIALDAELQPITMFDYYHASVQSIIHPVRLLSIRGVNRYGRLLVMIHNLMMLDLYAVVIGRFYQLVQQSV